MKTLKSLALIAGLAFTTTVHLSAQATEQASQDPQKMAQKMTAALKQNVTGITPDQETKIVAVETDYAKGMIDSRNSTGDDHDAMRTKMQPFREARDAKLKTILTDDQYAQYQKAEAARSGHRGGN
jgi:periplasmic protein CpxP/Spy